MKQTQQMDFAKKIEDFRKSLNTPGHWGYMVAIIFILGSLGGFSIFIGAAGVTTWIKWDEIRGFFRRSQR